MNSFILVPREYKSVICSVKNTKKKVYKFYRTLTIILRSENQPFDFLKCNIKSNIFIRCSIYLYSIFARTILTISSQYHKKIAYFVWKPLWSHFFWYWQSSLQLLRALLKSVKEFFVHYYSNDLNRKSYNIVAWKDIYFSIFNTELIWTVRWQKWKYPPPNTENHVTVWYD